MRIGAIEGVKGFWVHRSYSEYIGFRVYEQFLSAGHIGA